ncbi:antA/AntB antirepressor family protein [Chondrinema litorale]|uniref:antA/AntB antirepressor family protein n=1 Tax=Chondrinema litorale TaxID=2994555 RepID=UPI002542A492|nr:antA/AntB antirepressor family protein [Chondrinema litorale]UZR95953.1 antA/AntB antirepressor family protein [Chondrinema litorale]
MELIKIYKGNLVNARDLHQFLDVKTRFSDWIKRMLEYGFVENKDFLTKLKKEYRQTYKEYYLTITCAKEISMLQRTDKGKEARLYFIKAEETLIGLKHNKHNKRLESFMKLEASKDKLSANIQSIGGTEDDYFQIDLAGRKVFFNGSPLPDEVLSEVLLKGRDFATAMTNENFKGDITSLEDAASFHQKNHADIRNILKENTGKNPEEIAPEGDIKNLEE